MTAAPLLASPLSELAQALEEGNLTSEQLVASAIEAYRASDDNAYIQWCPEQALALAKASDRARKAGAFTGPLMGLPVSVKDLFGVPGLPIHAGCAGPLPDRWQAAGPVIKALNAQLAPVVGKTHSVELAFGGLGTNSHWGTPRNPWAKQLHRVPGGSSSGAGVSLVNGTAALALGTDTAGSIRVPAAMTGVAGLKLTAGRWPTRQIVPLSPTLDTPGLMARRVEDLAYAFRALDPVVSKQRLVHTRVPELADLTFGVPSAFFWENCSPGIAEAVESAFKVFERAGARLVPFELPGVEQIHELFLKGGVAAPELAAFIREDIPEIVASLDPNVAARLRTAEELPAWEYIQRLKLMAHLSAEAASQMQQVDAVLTPTVTLTPPAVDSLKDPKAYAAANIQALRNTAIGNYLGLCGLSLPVGLDQAGLPVGLQVLTGPWQEERLLGIGQAIERGIGPGPDILGN
ncbi:MAG: 2-amino-5-chloromuconate deaminase [Marinobacter sp. T13-3]|nr:MAG: 2-amino-5-chloromuconate deaminase [Marinobacter sp. T13-3]